MIKNQNIYDVVVIGGGPAGLMSAGVAGKNGAKVLLLEKNDELGKKLLISGGGRCNLTNANPDHRDFISNYGKKGSFLFTPFSIFGTADTVKFFNKLGLKTKVEDNFRVFPSSNRSQDVLNVLVRYARDNGVKFKFSAEVDGFKKSENTITSVLLKSGQEIKAKKFILATGGKSHPETGSTGDGFKWLSEIGHNVIKPNPALVPIKIKEIWIGDFSGITFEYVGVSIWQDGKKIMDKRGKILFTHNGLSGPTILNMSKDVGEVLKRGETKIAIDFFAGIDQSVLQERFIKLFEENSNKKLRNLMIDEIPSKIFLRILDILSINGEIKMHSISREERIAIVNTLKKFELTIKGLAGFYKSIVSSGGLDLKEVDFKTMRSKIFDNLFFAGDILDFDRPSGGFSLQLCWTTGYIAGKAEV